MQIELRDHDPSWTGQFENEQARISAALGPTMLEVHHVGSTSVPGLAAKPTIDIVLAVPDSTDEETYLPGLEAEGFKFVLRERDWFEHRLLRREPQLVNLHVFTVGCTEIAAMIGFRDRLRSHAGDRYLYERTKRGLASLDWRVVQDYADAKSEVITDIKRRSGLA